MELVAPSSRSQMAQNLGLHGTTLVVLCGVVRYCNRK